MVAAARKAETLYKGQLAMDGLVNAGLYGRAVKANTYAEQGLLLELDESHRHPHSWDGHHGTYLAHLLTRMGSQEVGPNLW